METNPKESEPLVFNYLLLRSLIGIIALMLPLLTSMIAYYTNTKLGVPSSISVTYHLGAQNLFVGLLFVVAAFLFAYKGRPNTYDNILSDIAALLAVLVALFPTTCSDWILANATTVSEFSCQNETNGSIALVHGISAVSFFLILAYFCLYPFQSGTRNQSGKRGLRSKIYFICAGLMIGSMALAVLGHFAIPDEVGAKLKITFWAEVGCLLAFGVSWLVSGKYFKWMADDEDREPYTR